MENKSIREQMDEILEKRLEKCGVMYNICSPLVMISFFMVLLNTIILIIDIVENGDKAAGLSIINITFFIIYIVVFIVSLLLLIKNIIKGKAIVEELDKKDEDRDLPLTEEEMAELKAQTETRERKKNNLTIMICIAIGLILSLIQYFVWGNSLLIPIIILIIVFGIVVIMLISDGNW